MMKDRTTGEEREVDVCIRGTVGGRPIVVSVECRDHKRPQGVQWIDQMYGTHRDLETNRLVLVSHSGFTEGARDKAKVYGIDLFSLKEVDNDSPERLFPDVQSLWAKSWKLSIEKVEIAVDQVGDIPSHKVRAFADYEIFLEDGSTLGTVGDLAGSLVKSATLNKRLAPDIRVEHTYALAAWRPPLVRGQKPCLKMHEPQALLPILDVLITATCEVTIDEFPLRHGHYGDVRIAWGEGIFRGNEALLLVTSDQAGKLSFSLRATTPAANADESPAP